MALQRKSINHQRQNLDFHTGPTNCLLGRWSSFIIRTPLFFSIVTINEYCTIGRISIHHDSLFSNMFFLALLSILNLLLIEREQRQIKQKFQILPTNPMTGNIATFNSFCGMHKSNILYTSINWKFWITCAKNACK